MLYLPRIVVCVLFLYIANGGVSLAAKSPAQINIGMTAAFVSENGVSIYKEISDYLGEKAGIETKLVTGLSYTVINRMLEEGIIHIGFICGYPYVLSHDSEESPISLLAAPVMEGKRYNAMPIYFSDVIVHKNSNIETFEDLKGKRFVFNDKTSNSGYNMPRAKLISMKEKEGFFSQLLQSGSHEESIRMVAEGTADASAVDSLVLDYAKNTGEKYTKDIKVIEVLGPAAIPPVVYSNSLDLALRNKIKNVFLKMEEDTEGKRILEKAFLHGFVDIQDDHYNDVRQMHKLAVDNDFIEIK